MDNTQQGRQTLFFGSYLIRGLGVLITIVLALYLELDRINERFITQTDQLLRFAEQQTNTFENALEGFANFLATSDQLTEPQIRAYSEGIRALYPDLYMLEIATRVEHAQREAFEQAMHSNGYPGFSIHQFDYDTTRAPLPSPVQPFYYPITYICPMLPEAMPVLGLDLNSTSSMVRQAMRRASEWGHPVASAPFRLIEGFSAYLIYRPVTLAAEPVRLETGMSHHSYAILVLRTRDLLPDELFAKPDFSVTVKYGKAPDPEFAHVLIDHADTADNHIGAWPLPTLTRTLALTNRSQPFVFDVERRIHLADFDALWLLMFITIGASVSVGASRLAANWQKQKHLEQETHFQLYHQANFDALTGLPNMNLLVDRAEQALKEAARSNTRVAFYYLDLDRFKWINDSYGHAAGDELLLQIADRLQQTLRGVDTASRIHGDEFMVILQNVADRQTALKLRAKLCGLFERPFVIRQHALEVRASIGTALYPDDGDDFVTLMNIADRRMYEGKSTAKDTSTLSS